MPEIPLLILKLVLWSGLAMIIHELGHLVAARRCKVPASELGLGMGPKLFGFRFGNLRFSLRALPLGSFLMIDGTALKERTVQEQLLVHLGGVVFNVMAGVIAYGTMFGWFNLLLAAGNLLPLYQHDGWKCGVVIMRALMQGKNQPAERVFTFSGGFVSLAIAASIIRLYI
jgi:membrane-associated protease RseP (regulator of RpoE activity)